MSDQPPVASGEAPLQFRGGIAGLFVPFGVMFAGVLWLGVTGVAVPEAYWPVLVLSLFVGLVLVRDQQRYVDALIVGVSSSMLAVMLLAWFLAGILGRLLSQTGIIEGLVWVTVQMGLPVAWFPLVTFLISASLSLSTGTSIGTILAATPILFPAGFAFGADPLLMLGAIIGGAFVGDNLAPISDTTIVSAYSQGTEVSIVVRSRLRYAAVAAAATLGLYIWFALTADAVGVEPGRSLPASPRGLVMLAVPVLLVVLMIKGRHLVTALLYSLAFGFALGLVAGLLRPSDLLSVDPASFAVGGIVVTGIQGMVGIAIFTFFLMALAGTLEAGGMVTWLVRRAERFATTPQRAELSIVGATLLLNGLTGAGTPSMVILGPFVRRLGHKFHLAPWRRGNLLDACSTTLIGFLPYSVAVLIPFSLVADTVAGAGLDDFTPVHLVPFVFYCWALLLTIVFAAATGWGREWMSPAAHAKEARELYAEPLVVGQSALEARRR